jgi:type IV pilus assembly protein PilC
MPTFRYTARDRSGREFRGTYTEIAGINALRGELSRIGCDLVRARRVKKHHAGRSRIKAAEIVRFAYKFSGMYSAGLSVTCCLETLAEQAERPALRSALSDVKKRVEAGASLTKAFEPYRSMFSEFFLGMLEAGEASGKLIEALEMSAVYLDKREQLRAKIRAAFVYPVAVGMVCVMVLLALLIFIVPVFTKLYANLRVPLPGPTLVLVMLSRGLRMWIWVVLPAGIAVGWLLARLFRSSGLRRGWDRLKLRLPLFGKLNRLILVSRFMRPFSMLIAVGVSVIDAFRMAGDVVRSAEIREVARGLQKMTQAGNPVGKSLGSYEIFPSEIVQMAVSGEQVGKLSEMLTKGVDLLDRDIERMMDALVVKLEPVLTLAMGLIIGLVLMGVYLPMFDYMTHLR